MKAHRRFLSDAGFDGKDVKSPKRIFQATRAKELTSHASQVAMFLQVNGVFRRGLAYFSLGSSFHFHECEDRAVVGHDIEFPFYSGMVKFRAITM